MRLPRPLQWRLRPRKKLRPSARPTCLRLEALEERAVPTSFTPLQIRHAYGFDRVAFVDATHSQVAGDGRGITIALIDAYDDPNIASDLVHFDSTYGLPAPASFTKVNQSGGTTYPSPNRGWAGEIALDVEYAHAMAPGAAILLVEANDPSTANLDTAVRYAASHGAAVISMSYGGSEYPGELSEDSVYTHAGVTYFASTGDGGAPGTYQAYSPNVVAVGGTSLYLSGGAYLRESGWGGGGGGISRYEHQPAYQSGVVTQSSTFRTTPDVALVADPNTGVDVYDTYGGGGLYGTGGTSAASPIMAGLAAVVDQGRAYLFGRAAYNGTDFLNALYHLPQSDLTDITSGNNGFAAGPGYDLVTGRGSPIADRFVSGMIGAPVLNPLTNTLLVTGGGRGSGDVITLGQSGGRLTVQVSAGNPVAGAGIPVNQTFSYTSGQFGSVALAPGDGSTTVIVDDSADGSDRNVTFAAGSLTGLPFGTINFGASVSALVFVGGGGNNTYTVTGAPGPTTLNTGGGTDTVNVRAAVYPLTVNSASGSGADAITLGSTSHTLAGITASVTVNGAATDSLLLDDQGFTGGRTYTVTDTTLDWGGPTVTYSGLGAVTIDGGAGGNTFAVLASSPTAAVTLAGGGSDTLVGSNAGNVFALTGANAGTLGGGAYGSAVGFSGVANLTAGGGGDTFQFADGASLSGNLVGGGADMLDYTAYTTSVVVDLPAGAATGVGGAVSGVATVLGGSAAPAGGGVYNLLIGAGGDTLVGGTGRRNLLVAGGSSSTLVGGDGEDLLIAGCTAYDGDPALSSWLQIAAYWAGADDYLTRVANLTGGSGVPLLDATVASGNGGGNVVSGTGALALLYTDGADSIGGFDPTALLLTITP